MALVIAPQPTPSSNDTAHQFHLGKISLFALVAAMGGLLFGYDWVVIGGAKPFYEATFNLVSEADQAWAMSCALLGCLTGALLSGQLGDRFGRKPVLVLAAFLFALSSLAIAFAGNFSMFILWRIVGGLAIGIASNLSPLYIAEISPAAFRGRLVAVNQLTIVIGILLAQGVNLWIANAWHGAPPSAPDKLAEMALLRESWHGTDGWRWMFGVTAIPSLLFLFGACLVPESPRWLGKQGRFSQAEKVLGSFGDAGFVSSELSAIRATVSEKKQSLREALRWLGEKRLRIPLILGITLAVFQQWCGINVIFNYAEEIFKAAGYDISDTLKNIAWTGSVNLVFTLVAMAFVDKIGRRPLMLGGAAALVIIYTALGACYALGIQGWPLLILVLAAIGAYAMSLAPVTWVVISEIFPNRIRGLAMSVSVFALWVACFLLTYTFPYLNKHLGPAGTFWCYAGICVAGFLFVWKMLPETKGRSLEDLEAALAGKT